MAALFLGIDLMVNIEKVNATLLKAGHASVTPREWLFIETMNQADLSLAFIVRWIISKRCESIMLSYLVAEKAHSVGG